MLRKTLVRNFWRNGCNCVTELTRIQAQTWQGHGSWWRIVHGESYNYFPQLEGHNWNKIIINNTAVPQNIRNDILLQLKASTIDHKTRIAIKVMKSAISCGFVNLLIWNPVYVKHCQLKEVEMRKALTHMGWNPNAASFLPQFPNFSSQLILDTKEVQN